MSTVLFHDGVKAHRGPRDRVERMRRQLVVSGSRSRIYTIDELPQVERWVAEITHFVGPAVFESLPLEDGRTLIRWEPSTR